MHPALQQNIFAEHYAVDTCTEALCETCRKRIDDSKSSEFQQKVENIARSYLSGEPIFILSAQIPSSSYRSWTHLWYNDSQATACAGACALSDPNPSQCSKEAQSVDTSNDCNQSKRAQQDVESNTSGTNRNRGTARVVKDQSQQQFFSTPRKSKWQRRSKTRRPSNRLRDHKQRRNMKEMFPAGLEKMLSDTLAPTGLGPPQWVTGYPGHPSVCVILPRLAKKIRAITKIVVSPSKPRGSNANIRQRRVNRQSKSLLMEAKNTLPNIADDISVKITDEQTSSSIAPPGSTNVDAVTPKTADMPRFKPTKCLWPTRNTALKETASSRRSSNILPKQASLAKPDFKIYRDHPSSDYNKAIAAEKQDVYPKKTELNLSVQMAGSKKCHFQMENGESRKVELPNRSIKSWSTKVTTDYQSKSTLRGSNEGVRNREALDAWTSRVFTNTKSSEPRIGMDETNLQLQDYPQNSTNLHRLKGAISPVQSKKRVRGAKPEITDLEEIIEFADTILRPSHEIRSEDGRKADPEQTSKNSERSMPRNTIDLVSE